MPTCFSSIRRPRAMLLTIVLITTMIGIVGYGAWQSVSLAQETKAPSTASASASSEAPPPTLHEGDTWTDKVKGADKAFKIDTISSDGTVAVNQWGAQMETDQNWNTTKYRSLVDENSPPTVYAKPVPIYPFPLTPGKTWKEEVKWQVPDISLNGKSEVEGKIGNWEDVTVPAGTFHAIEGEVKIRSIGRAGIGDLTTITYWYAPQVNRFVKYKMENAQEGEIDAQMVSYKPASH